MEVLATMTDFPESVPATPDSFHTLFKTYYAHVVRQIMRITRDQAIAEDLAQDVFMRLYHQDLSEIDNIAGWLTQASIYAAYNHLRSERRRLARDETPTADTVLVEPSTEERWLRQEEIEAVQEALIDLSERDRNLLLLKYSGYDYAELASITQVESGSVGTLLARAKRRFRDLYQRRRGNDR